MTTIINGSSPSITFSDNTTQTTAGLPLTGGTITGNVTTSGLTIGTTAIGAGNATRFKNRFINGNMAIDQRYAGGAISAATLGSGGYTVDRWAYAATQSAKFSAQQNQGSVTPPIGFNNYLGFTSASAYSVLSTDIFTVRQYIEGFNFCDLGWGTANAKTITVSAWVYSSLTGTFGGSILNYAGTRSYPFTYSIPTANTWTQISITIAGDTGGTWVGASSAGAAFISFGLGAGSTYSGTAGSWSSSQLYSATGATSVVGTNGATWYVTGVQLEVGSSATGFDVRDYTSELAMCQRYFYKMSGASAYLRFAVGPANSGTNGSVTFFMQVPMRTVPSSVTTTGSLGIWAGATVYSVSAVAIESVSSSPYTAVLNATSSGLTSGTTYQLIGNADANASVGLSAEL
jgi:hypothetical protein